MLQRALSCSSGGGGTLNIPTSSAGSKITSWTPTTPTNTDVPSHVLSGTFYVTSQINVGDVILTVSPAPSKNTEVGLATPTGTAVGRKAILNTSGQLILTDGGYMAAGYTWKIVSPFLNQATY